MAALQIAPFDDGFMEDAVALLAARRQRDEAALRMGAQPLMPDNVRFALSRAWQAPDARGVMALRDGRMVGFLIGAPLVNETWGRSAWTQLGGHALAAGEDPDLYRDLYAALAPHFMAHGCFAHYAMVPATDRAALEAWYALSFGQQEVYTLRQLRAPDIAPPPLAPDIEIRRAVPDDLETIVALREILSLGLTRSPSYAIYLPGDRRDFVEGYAELLADPTDAIWLAQRNGHALGAVEVRPAEPEDAPLYIPERSCYLTLVVTRPEERRQGISTALITHGLAHAAAAGMTSCVTDWRTSNLAISRLLPRLGFRPAAYRLTRRIDERIAWAPGLSSPDDAA